MSIGWVAGSVRARLLDRHRVGRDTARAIGESPTLAAARDRLGGTAYSKALDEATSIAATQHAVWATVLWDLRVLAGWLPARGVAALRTFAAFFEIENIESRLVALEGGGELTTFDLGALASVWPQMRDAVSSSDLRDRLRLWWAEAESDDRADILRSCRLEWARRMSEIGVAEQWGAGFAALVVARALVSGHHWGLDLTRRAPQLGRRAASASSLDEFVSVLPDSARWVFEAVGGVDANAADLWMAEARWWSRLDRDGGRLLRRTRPGPDIVIGAVGRRMSDAWRTTSVLSLVGRGPCGQELLDVLA